LIPNGNGSPNVENVGVSHLPSLAEARPDLAAQLVDEDPTKVSIGSGRTLLWRCPNHDEPFPQVVGNRVKGHGCCYCAGKRVLVGYNDLATTHPDLVADLVDPAEAQTVTAGSDIELSWRCPNHDEPYLLRASHRTNGIGCGYCAHQKVLPGYNDLATERPDLAAELVGTDPTTVVAGTGAKLRWACPDHGHEYEATGAVRLRGSGCPYCANKRVSAGFNDLATTRPDLAAQLIGTDPRTVTASTGKRLTWKCERHGGTFVATGADRVNGYGCGVCYGQQIEIGYNDLATTHPALATELVDTDPTTLTAFSHKKVLWRCPKHDEPFSASVANRVLGRGCGFCRGFQVLGGYNDMATTHPALAAELVDRDPETVIAGARVRYRWRCSRCRHEWESMGYSRTIGNGCPACAPSGYDPTLPAHLYLLARHGEQQVGITTNLTKRLASHRLKGAWEVVDTHGPIGGEQAQHIERQIKVWLRDCVGRIRGTHENWSTANLEVESLSDLAERAGVELPGETPSPIGK
jgi:uncharacterized OB-fold protein